jgi:starch synthase
MMAVDEKGNEYDDNDSRAIFYARGVLETVKKLRWCPEVIHCHGWMTALAPIYIKRAYCEEPSFRGSKVVFSLYDSAFEKPLSKDFVSKLIVKGITKKELSHFPSNATYTDLCKLAIDYSDGVIQNSANVSEELIEYARKSGKPFLEYKEGTEYADACSEFYDQVWGDQAQ